MWGYETIKGIEKADIPEQGHQYPFSWSRIFLCTLKSHIKEDLQRQELNYLELKKANQLPDLTKKVLLLVIVLFTGHSRLRSQ